MNIYLEWFTISIGIEVTAHKYDYKVFTTIKADDVNTFLETGDKYDEVFKSLDAFQPSIVDYYIKIYKKNNAIRGTISNKTQIMNQLICKYNNKRREKNICEIRHLLRESLEGIGDYKDITLFYFTTITGPDKIPLIFLMEERII